VAEALIHFLRLHQDDSCDDHIIYDEAWMQYDGKKGVSKDEKHPCTSLSCRRAAIFVSSACRASLKALCGKIKGARIFMPVSVQEICLNMQLRDLISDQYNYFYSSREFGRYSK